MKSESEIQNEITAYLSVVPMLKWFVPKRVGDSNRRVHKSSLGMPDIIVCYKGRFIGLEVKSKTGGSRDKQKEFKEDITRSHGIYRIVRSVDEVENLIKVI